jgi:transketolase
MSLAAVAYLLFQNVLVHDPADDQWLGWDRLVLSAGHTSLTLYIQLFLSWYGLEIGDRGPGGTAQLRLEDSRAAIYPSSPEALAVQPAPKS